MNFLLLKVGLNMLKLLAKDKIIIHNKLMVFLKPNNDDNE